MGGFTENDEARISDSLRVCDCFGWDAIERVVSRWGSGLDGDGCAHRNRYGDVRGNADDCCSPGGEADFIYARLNRCAVFRNIVDRRDSIRDACLHGERGIIVGSEF